VQRLGDRLMDLDLGGDGRLRPPGTSSVGGSSVQSGSSIRSGIHEGNATRGGGASGKPQPRAAAKSGIGGGVGGRVRRGSIAATSDVDSVSSLGSMDEGESSFAGHGSVAGGSLDSVGSSLGSLDNWYSQLPASERQAGRARSMDPGHYYGVATDEAHERVKLRLGSSGQQREVWVKRKVKKKTQSRGTAMLRKTVFGGIAGAAATAHAIMKHAVE